jgi:osmotically-inducible protein OsmY
MAVTSTEPNDEDVQREVLTELKFDAEVGQSEIGVVVDDRVVTAAAEAERVAWSAPGVTEVDNRIVVRH